MSFFRRKSDKRQSGSSIGKGKTPPSPSVVQSPVSSSQPLNATNGGYGLAITPEGSEEGASVGPSLLLLEEDSNPGDLGVRSGPDSQIPNSSRLSKSFQDLMRDREAIPHLIQYMESEKAGNLIRFYLDAESFQASTWTRIRTHSLNIVSKSSLLKRKPSAKDTSNSPNVPRTPVDTSQVEKMGAEVDSNNIQVLPESLSNQAISVVISSPSQSATDSGDLSSVMLESGGVPNVPSDVTSFEGNSGSVKADESADHRVREKCKDDGKGFNIAGNIVPAVNENGDSNAEVAGESAEENKETESGTDIHSSVTVTNVPKPSSLHQTSSAKSSHSDLGEKLKKSVEQDAVRVYTKYLAQDATHPIGVTDELRNEAIRKICREDGEVDPMCFVDCQKFAYEQIETRYYPGFKDSLHHCKHQVDILTGGKVYLSDILYNETAFFYFMEYMEREGLSHLLQFCMAVDNFNQTLTSLEQYDGLEAQGDAMVIYDKYFSLQAAQPLGFPDSVRFEVEGNICREEGPLPDCFVKPREIVLHTISKLHFPKYLQSDVYYRYLSELVSSAQSAQEFPLEQRKRRGSESSSEHSLGSVGGESISSKNTLLATGQSHRQQASKLREEIIEPSFLNPDLLWKRSESNMSLGKIDTLGSFVSDFIPDPEVSKEKKSSGSRFFKSKKDKDKEQEEMARRVAQMILNDVTSVTQAIGEMKNPSGGEPIE